MTDKPQAVPRRLSVLSYAQGFTLWHYNARLPYSVGPFVGIKDSPKIDYSSQTLVECLTPGFFQPFAGTGLLDMFNPGDMIAISASDGAALVWVEQTAPVVVVWPLGRTPMLGPIGKQEEGKP